MFQFRAFPTLPYLIQIRLIRYCRTGFPHSEISGSMRMCHSPKLIAACHVLHRLLMPRHSPCALISLTNFFWFSELCRFQKNSCFHCSYPIISTIYFCDLSIAPSVALLLSSSLCSVFKVQTGQRPDLNTQIALSI